MQLTERERAVLTVMQRGIELQERPFRGFALPEDDVVALLHRAQAGGLVRRFGGVFDSRRLGYRSLLCALDAPAKRIATLAGAVVRHPGVTHCYERRRVIGEGRCPRLWFTLAMPHDTFESGLEVLRGQLAGAELLLLPALRRFKLDVVFDLCAELPNAAPPDRATAPEPSLEDVLLTSGDRDLVRMLDQQMPVSARPFDAIAQGLDLPVQGVLNRLARWHEQGVLRRIGVVLHHRAAGFACNGLCVWPVGSGIASAGHRVAGHPTVTHCYQRLRLDTFPYDLYAMIHAADRSAIVTLYERISDACGLPTGMLCVSTRELKKSSMRYFPD